MRDFRIALVAQDSPVGVKAENLSRAMEWVRKAKQAGAELVCLPELNITGHAGDPAMVREAEPVSNGPAMSALLALAREQNIYICAGIAEDERGIHYNTQFIVGPDGYWGKQRKVHLSADEYFFFRGGTDLPVFDLPFARVGIIICYDNLLPEMARCLAVKGAELLLCPHAARFGKWPETVEGRREAVKRHKEGWRLTHCCRAHDNGVYVALCNDAGQSALSLKEVEANHAGGCMVIAPDGKAVAETQTPDVAEEMIVADLSGDAVARPRMNRCFNLQTRRPEVFKVLCEPTK
jgi:predicted amidohydrolase